MVVALLSRRKRICVNFVLWAVNFCFLSVVSSFSDKFQVYSRELCSFRQHLRVQLQCVLFEERAALPIIVMSISTWRRLPRCSIPEVGNWTWCSKRCSHLFKLQWFLSVYKYVSKFYKIGIDGQFGKRSSRSLCGSTILGRQGPCSCPWAPSGRAPGWWQMKRVWAPCSQTERQTEKRPT